MFHAGSESGTSPAWFYTGAGCGRLGEWHWKGTWMCFRAILEGRPCTVASKLWAQAHPASLRVDSTSQDGRGQQSAHLPTPSGLQVSGTVFWIMPILASAPDTTAPHKRWDIQLTTPVLPHHLCTPKGQRGASHALNTYFFTLFIYFISAIRHGVAYSRLSTQCSPERRFWVSPSGPRKPGMTFIPCAAVLFHLWQAPH